MKRTDRMKRRSLRAVLVIALVTAAGGAVVAQDQGATSPFSFSVTGLYTYWWGIVPTGLTATARYAGLTLLPGLRTTLEDDIGGGYQYNYFFRNADGSPAINLAPNDAGTSFAQADFVNDLGIRQGILWNPSQKRNLLESFLYYRAHYDYNFQDPSQNQLLFASSLPGRVQLLSNAIQSGFAFDTTTYDAVHKTRGGVYAESSVEWGPSFLLNQIGGADYYRLNIRGYFYQTLYTSAVADRNLFSLYWGDQLMADYAGGSSIPLPVMAYFGGRNPRYGLGDAVRGFEEGSYDTNLKVVNNLEIRATGPAIIWRDLVPGVYAFVDGGYYDGYFGDPTNAPGGFLASTGVGGYVDFFELANVTLLLAFPLYGHRIDQSPYAIVAHFSLQF